MVSRIFFKNVQKLQKIHSLELFSIGKCMKCNFHTDYDVFYERKKVKFFYLDFYFICRSDNDFFSHHDPAHPTIYVVVVLQWWWSRQKKQL